MGPTRSMANYWEKWNIGHVSHFAWNILMSDGDDNDDKEIQQTSLGSIASCHA